MEYEVSIKYIFYYNTYVYSKGIEPMPIKSTIIR